MLNGEALDGLSRTPEAIAEFQAAAKVATQEPNVHFGLGYLYWKAHRYEEAKTEFNSELANDPAHAQSLVYLGDMAMKEKHPAEALVWLRKAALLKNDLRLAYIDMGAVLTEQKRYEDAVAALQTRCRVGSCGA